VAAGQPGLETLLHILSGQTTSRNASREGVRLDCNDVYDIAISKIQTRLIRTSDSAIYVGGVIRDSLLQSSKQI
jgi:hypothetical protein